jgi:hypothetical protein
MDLVVQVITNLNKPEQYSMVNMMQNDDLENVVEALKIKVQAHEKFIIMHLDKKQKRRQAFETFGTIYKNICVGKIQIPSKYDQTFCRVFDKETHHKVIDTYGEILNGVTDRYTGRSGDAFLEKL